MYFVVWLVFQEHCIQQQHPLISRFLNKYLERYIFIITKDKLMHAHKHTFCQPLNLILITLLHHRFCRRTKSHQRWGDELHSCVGLVEDGKKPFLWCMFILFIYLAYFSLFRLRLKGKSTAVWHLSSSQKTNPNAFFYFLDMSHLSQQILLSSSLVIREKSFYSPV